HTAAIVEHQHIGFVGTFFAGLAKVDPHFGRAPLDGVIHVLAERRRGAVIAHVAQRADQSLPEKERNRRFFFDDAVQDRFPAARGFLAPGWVWQIAWVLKINLGNSLRILFFWHLVSLVL